MASTDSADEKSIALQDLTPEQSEKTKSYSVVEGSGYNIMVGFSEQYIVPFALRLGATNPQIAILSSVPTFLGSMSQVIGARLSEKFTSRKNVVASLALIQGILLIPLFLIPFLTRSMVVLTALFSLHMVLSNMCAPAWNSMMGDLVLDKERASYFARRNKSLITALFFSILAAGLILHFFEGLNIWAGFGVLFSISFFGRMISWVYLSKHFDPPRRFHSANPLPFREFIKNIKGNAFGKFALFRISIAFSAMIAVPFFSVYMLKNLGFSYIQYSLVLLAPMIVKAFTSTYWGAYSARLGNRNIMYVSALLVAIIPLIWALAGFFFESNALIIFLLVLLAEIISGFAWGGFELTTFNYMLDASEKQDRARLFAYFNVLFGSAVLVGGLLSSFLVGYFAAIQIGVGAIMAVFFISFVLRFFSVVSFLPRVPEVENHPHVNEGKLFVEMVITRPLGFVVHNTLSTLTFIEHEMIQAGEKTTRVIKKGLSKNKK